MAPVLMSGEYEWRGLEANAFPELEGPIRRDFGMTDRVVLLSEDLAQIEAIGWATPTQFSSPSIAREAVKFERAFLGHKIDQESVEIDRDQLNQMVNERVMTIFTRSQGENAEGREGDSVDGKYAYQDKVVANDMAVYDKFLLQQSAYFLPWRAIEPISDQIKIELTHLFISRHEIERIEAGKPVDEISRAMSDGSVGRGSHFAKKREEVLMAAIRCQLDWPEDCKDVPSWAKTIGHKCEDFWPEEGTPPYGFDRISRLLSDALKFGNPQTARKMHPKKIKQ